MQEETQKSVPCLDCLTAIVVPDGSEIGDILLCTSCGVEVELINTDPLEVDYLYVQK